MINNNKNTLIKQGFILTLVCLLNASSLIYAADISDFYAYTWSETSGWLNFKSKHQQVSVYDDHLEGYIWAENIGWIRLGTYTEGSTHRYTNDSAATYGVNNDGQGNLSGYAWAENAGWINFNPEHSQVVIDKETGDFDGYAWGENIGWIHFNQHSSLYKLQHVAIISSAVLPAIEMLESGFLNELQNTSEINGENNFFFTQETNTGNLSLSIGNFYFYIRPIQVQTVDTNSISPGISINSDGVIDMVSEQGTQITMLSEPAALSQFQESLGKIDLYTKQYDHGMLKIMPLTDTEIETPRFVASRADYVSQKIAPSSRNSGIHISIDNNNLFIINHYFTKNGSYYKQTFYPTPVDWDRLKHYLGSFGEVSINSQGYISINIAKKVYRFIVDYIVVPTNNRIGEVKISARQDLNNDGMDDFQITYPNGEQQVLYHLE